MNYLLDGRCEISNNHAEWKAKSYAIGRKAFLFHTSEAGAGASAVMYSIVETAKANNLNIFQYLYTVLLYVYAGLHEFVRRYRAADAMEWFYKGKMFRAD